MILFEFKILEHLFGVGFAFDKTLVYHWVIYGWTVFIISAIPKLTIRHGLVGSLTASLFLEINQMYQWHWECGFFGIGDFIVSWFSAYLFYLILHSKQDSTRVSGEEVF